MYQTQVAERLGLGRLLDAPVLLKDDEQNPVWKAITVSGAWAVKVVRPWGDFWLPMAAQAGALEAAAWKAGVTMAEPQSTTLGKAGLWRPIEDGVYARAVRFVEGSHPIAPTSDALAAWAGGLVAGLAQCAIPADPTVDGDYRSYSPEEWEDWFTQAEQLEVLSAEHVRIFKRSVEQTEAMIAEQQDLWRSRPGSWVAVMSPNFVEARFLGCCHTVSVVDPAVFSREEAWAGCG